MVALGKEGALFGPFSPLHVLCIMPPWDCPRWGLTQVCGCLGGTGNGPGSDSLVWMWGREGPLWSACVTGCSKTALGCILFCALLHPGWGINHCFSICCVHRTLLLHSALQQRPPGAGTRDSGAAWGSKDISTGVLWLAPNCSKICSRNTLGEEGNIFVFFLVLKSKVQCPCSTACLWQIPGKLVQPAPVWAGRALPVLGALPGSTGI